MASAFCELKSYERYERERKQKFLWPVFNNKCKDLPMGRVTEVGREPKKLNCKGSDKVSTYAKL